ncbi:MAG: hypothetical protein QNJ15_13925 [Erythrobacter sp.]|nr:hypothetical protein [Erythrobacter sp.]
MTEAFETMLTGGHPNSLGRTIDVVETVLANPDRFSELYDCYRSEDEVVRLRVSNAMRRVEIERHDLLVPFIDRFIEEIGALDQPSAQWTLAKLFEALEPDMSAAQKSAAQAIMQRNLAEHDDWIVLQNSMIALFDWSEGDAELRAWLKPQLEHHSKDKRKSVAKRATMLLDALRD